MNKYKLLLLALMATGFLLPTAARAVGFEIQVGDRPYYNHGPRYWHNDYQMMWVPGHMTYGHHWMHGQYVRVNGSHRHHGMNGHQGDYRADGRR